jgi:hypothetical protein
MREVGLHGTAVLPSMLRAGPTCKSFQAVGQQQYPRDTSNIFNIAVGDSYRGSTVYSSSLNILPAASGTAQAHYTDSIGSACMQYCKGHLPKQTCYPGRQTS